MKKLYKMSVDYGRQGEVEGLFIGDSEKVEGEMIGQEIYFGEILGKHSEVYFEWSSEHFKVIDLPQETLAVLKKELGDTLSGYNPQGIWYEREIFEEEGD